MGTLTTVPFSKLQLADENIRKSDPGAQHDAELKASIDTHGVLVNLIVSPAPRGIKLVNAGMRRYKAVAALVAEKKLPKSYPVPCYILDADESAEEAALIENTLRVEMHPLDEFESYSRLHHEQGLTIDQIAARFGRANIDIRKRLKLGNVAPELRELCRSGELAIDTLAAFTGTEDIARQVECYKSLKAKQYVVNSNTVRNWLAESCYTSDSGLARIINLDTYQERGGLSSTDLFASKVYLHDSALVDELVKETLSNAADTVHAEGWKWVDVDLEYFNKSTSHIARTLDPVPAADDEIPKKLKARESKLAEQLRTLEAELEALDIEADEYFDLEEKVENARQDHYNATEEIDQLAKFSDEQKAIAGAIITVDHNGSIRIFRGRVKAADKKAANKQAAEQDREQAQEQGTWQGEPDETAELSQVLKNDLSNWRLAALQLDLYYSTEIAADLMLFAVAWQALSGSHYSNSVSIQLSAPGLATTVEDTRGTATIRELDSARESLNLTWLDTDDSVSSMRAFRELTTKDKMKIMSWCAAKHLQTMQVMLPAIMQDCQTNVAKYWRPTASNFFKRAPKGLLLLAGKEMFDDDNFPDLMRAKPKTDLAHILEERIEQMSISECWLPEMMRV